MKKVLILIYILSVFFNISAKAQNVELELDKVYNLIKDGEYYYSRFNKSHPKNRRIYDNIEPFKLKYCKSKKSNFVYTIYSNQQCFEQVKLGNGIIDLEKGKKIKFNEFKNLDPNFSQKNNLVCIKRNYDPKKSFTFLIFYLTHTKSNDIYLNSIVRSGPVKHERQGVEDLKQRGKWNHKGNSLKTSYGYDFIFYKYSNKKFNEKIGLGLEGTALKIQASNSFDHNFYGTKCYANEEYWVAMFPNKEIKETESANKENEIIEEKIESLNPISRPEF